jgi:hypothetical protein
VPKTLQSDDFSANEPARFGLDAVFTLSFPVRQGKIRTKRNQVRGRHARAANGPVSAVDAQFSLIERTRRLASKPILRVSPAKAGVHMTAARAADK